ncbi:MAG: SdrD B-like domain-containing protein [Rubripirellula sp.]
MSIDRDDANPTHASEVHFTVTFDEAVEGVDASDFQLAVTGNVAGPSIASVTPLDANAAFNDVYTVKVSRGVGDGTLRLDVIDDDSIKEISGDALVSTSSSDGSFTTGQSYTIETSTVTGTVRSDADGDGVRDDGDGGLSGVTVYVDLNQNMVRDPSEPTTTTLADNPATSGINEAGQFSIGNLGSGSHDVRIEVTGNTRQSAPLTSADGTLGLSLFENAIRPTGSSGDGPKDIEISPDGNTAIVGWGNLRVSSFYRDPVDGSFSFVNEIYDYTRFNDVKDIAFHPSGDFAYVTGRSSSAINVFSVAPNGALTWVDAETSSDDPNINQVRELAVTPDGDQLIVTASQSHSVLVYNINSTTGTLTLSQTFTNGFNGITTLPYPAKIAISPDGSLVAVTNYSSNNDVQFFDRDLATGTISVGQTPIDLANGYDALYDVDFSSDGKNLYVADAGEKIWTLDRDLATGLVTLAGSTDLGGIDAEWLAISPDGSSLFATSPYGDAVIHLSRDTADGSLTLEHSHTAGTELNLFDLPAGLAVSPDGKNLYAVSASSDRLANFWIDRTGVTAASQTAQLQAGTTTGNVNFSVAVDSPTVASFTSVLTEPINATSVNFQVQFSEPVTGVDASAFQLHDSTYSGAAITSVTGSGTTWTVTVSTPTGQGFVQLELIDNNLILDADSASLGGVGTGSVVARSNRVWVDSVAPNVVAIAPANHIPASATTIDFYVSFSEPVTGFDVAELTTSDTGTMASTVQSVTPTNDPQVFVATVGVTGTSGTVTLTLSDDDSIIDAGSIQLGGPGTTGAGDGSFASLPVTIDAPSIIGTVWDDANQNGRRDIGESGHSGAIVFADLDDDGVRDAGEPFTVSLSDDVSTTDIDESGQYVINGLSADTTYQLLIDNSIHTQTNPLTFSQDDGLLTYRGEIVAVPQIEISLLRAETVIASDDGRHLYTTSLNGHTLGVFERDLANDSFMRVQSIQASTPGFTGLSAPRHFALTPDGRFGYLGSADTIYVVTRDPATGLLTFASKLAPGDAGPTGLTGSTSFIASPDGQWLYASGPTNGFSVFAIDQTDGSLTLVQQFVSGQNGVSGLYAVQNVAVTPDGSQVFVTSNPDRNLQIFDVTPGTGRLVLSQTFTTVYNSEDTAFSPDGKFAYVAETDFAYIRRYQRDPLTRDWNYEGRTLYSAGDASGIDISSDGRFMYLANEVAHSITVLQRDETTGALTVIQTLLDADPHPRLSSVRQVIVTPDDQDVFAVSHYDNAMTRFGRVGGTTSVTARSVTTSYINNVGGDFGVYNPPPTVASLLADSPNPTGASTATFDLTFDESVSGVDVSDFSLVESGITGSTIASVTGGPTQYTITIDTGLGQGTVQLVLNDDDSIIDLGGQSLGGTGDNGSNVSDLLTVNKAPPIVSSITGTTPLQTTASTVTFAAAFSKPVTGVDAGDFVLDFTGLTTPAIVSVTESTPSLYLIEVSTGAGEGTVQLDLVNNSTIADLNSIGLQNGLSDGDTFIIDHTAPTPLSFAPAVSSLPGDFEVRFVATFSEAVSGLTLSDFMLSTTDLVGAQIVAIEGSGNTYEVVVSTGEGIGTVGVSLVDDDSIVDGAGNPLGDVGPGNGNITSSLHSTLRSTPFVISPTTFADELDGDTSSLAALRTNPGGTGISLREVIVAANQSPERVHVNLSAGTYTLSIAGSRETLGLSGDLDITEDLTIIGVPGATVIDATGLGDRAIDLGYYTALHMFGVTVTGGTATGSTATGDYRGGGLRTDFGTDLHLDQVNFHDNTAISSNSGSGGALDLFGTTTIVHSTFANNESNNDGGAIATAGSQGTLTILASTFDGNNGPGGGAIYSVQSLLIRDSLFTGNNATLATPNGSNGGAINANAGSSVTITNSTFTGHVSGFGGAMYLTGDANISNSTIVNNSSPNYAGGIYFGGSTSKTLQIGNSIIAGNTSVNGGPNVYGTLTSLGGNLVIGTSGSTGFGASGDIFPSDAMLGSLADNGGPTWTHLPLPGSPTIDAGSNAIATDRDARGIARPQGTSAEIGAVEILAGSNQAPTATDGLVSTSEDTPLTFDARTGDTDPDGDTLSVTLLQPPRYGVATVGSDQLVTYTPSSDFYGSDKLVYQIVDHAGEVDSATIVISVTPQNDAPETISDTAQAILETSINIDVLANDSDIDGDSFSIDSFTQPTSGVVTDNGDGTLAYIGNAGFLGTDTFTYTATDGNNVSMPATVTVNVSAIPVANDDSFNVEESGELRFFAFLGNTSLIMDSDAGDWIGQGLSYNFDASNSGISVSYNRVTSSNNPDQWRIGVDVNNYTGASSFAGDDFDMDFVAKEGDEITVGSYTGATRWPFNAPADPGIDVSATGRGCNTILGDFDIDALDLRTSGRVARLEMSFQQQCGATITPTSPGLTGTLVYSSPSYAHSILDNDVDDDGDELSAVLVTGPAHGTLELRDDGSVIYVADTGYTGPDSFTYSAVDPLGLQSAPATVSLNVTGVNDSPVVTAITPLDSINTFGTSVSYQLDFSEPVFLSQSSLNLVTTGLTGASIDSIQTNGSRASYIVAIDAGSGNGTAQLQVIDNNYTKDFAELPLGGPSAGDGNFTTAVTYNIETNPLRDIIGDVYIDANLNGQRDAGELGAVGQSVYIDANNNQTLDAGETIAITDATGHYVIADQPLGTYTIAVADQPGWFTSAASTGSATLTFAGGDVTLDLGIEENLTQISGIVYQDDDANGMWSGAEVGLGEWVIFLDANQNGQLDTGETSVLSQRDNPNTSGVDETGYYSFTDLPLGDHYVTIVPQANVHATTATMGWVTISDSNDVGLVDFGMYPLDTRISGVLFEDTNIDGVRDAGETALPGFTVYLDANANGIFDSGETSVVTTADDPQTSDDETGRFGFVDLDEGNHRVAVVGQPGHIFLNPMSLVLGFGSEPLEIELPIEANLTEISGTVFDDVDSDGTRQPGESGLAGWLVFVDLNTNGSYNSGEPSTYTLADDTNTAGIDELGTFSFSNLDLGSYTVVAQPPTGFTVTNSASFSGTIASSTDQFSGDFGAHFNGADVGGILFDDLNRNSIQDNGELPLVGITVFADYNGDGVPGALEPSDTTASDGSYLLANVIAGETAISIVTTEPQIVTNDVAAIPRLFVPDGQGIRELNPRDGATLDYLYVSVSATHGVELTGLAFDGTYLYAADSFLDVVLVIDPNNNGTTSTNVLDSIDLNIQSNQYISGLAVIGTTLYALDQNTDTILTYDLATDTLGAAFDIQGLNVGTTHHPGGFNLTRGLGESADGTQLTVSTTDQHRLYIDPATGLITGSDVGSNANDVGSGLAGASDRLYAGRANAYGIKVFDAAGGFLTQLTYNATAESLAAGPSERAGTLLTVVAGQDVTGLTMGLASSVGSITGTQFIDANGNGVFDTGELPVAGATVFVDTNGNFWPDAGEPQATSAADGTYTITGIGPGQHSVRSLAPEHFKPSSHYASEDRLYVAYPGTNLGSGFYNLMIRQVDPANGTVLATIPTTIPIRFAMEITFTGDSFIVIDNGNDELHRVALDGQLIETVPLGDPDGGGGFLAANDFGATWVGDSIVSVRAIDSTLYLMDFDRQTNQFTPRLPVSITASSTGLIPPSTWTTGVGRSADGQSIVLSGTNSNIALTIDVATGRGVLSQEQFYDVDARDSLGGEMFVADSGSPISVVDGTGSDSRLLDVGIYPFGLGAGTFRDTGLPATVTVGSITSGVNHGFVSTLSTISGVQFFDDNEDGQFDSNTELPQSGVTVFVDINANGFADAGEPQTTSSADGTYTLTGVRTGKALVRTITPAHQRPTVVSYAADRMFATGRVSDGNSPTGYTLDIRELDPATGNTLTLIKTDIPITFAHSTAFDGKQLIMVENNLDVLYKIALDGTLLETVPLPVIGNEAVFINGPVIARGSVYVLARIDGQPWVYRFDADTNQFVEPKALTSMLDASNDVPQFSTSLSESVDGQSIIAYTGDLRAFTIDPTTGRTTGFATLAETQGYDFAATAVGQELFVGSSGSNGTLVYNAAWEYQRTMTANYSRQGFGGGLYQDSGVVVDVAGGQATSDVSFGYKSILGTITGTILDDMNRDGISDVGDQPRVNATVFLDSNRNGILDTGEFSTTTDATGTYTFTGITPGDHQVQVMTTSDQRSITTAGPATRLFTTHSGSGFGPLVISELDPISGAVLNTLAAPDDSGNAGLALDQYALYFAAQDDLYSLDPDTGEVFAQLELPSGTYTGAAAVGGHVFVVEPSTDTILKIEPISQTVVATFTSTANLTGTLGENFDGTKLIASTGGNTVISIDPADGSEDFNVNSLWTGAGFGTAAGEHYHGSQGEIQIRNPQNQLTRTLPTPHDIGFAFGLAVAAVPHREARLNVAPSDVVSSVDFLIQSGLDTSDIELSAASINENIDTSSADVLFAELSAVDASPIGQHFFALTPGNGDDDNGKFVVVGNELRIKQNEVIDFETQPTYQVRVFVADNSQILMEKELTLTVNNLIEMSNSGPAGNGITIAGGTDQRSRVDSVTVEFDSAVTVEAGAFEIVNLTEPTKTIAVTLAPSSTSTNVVLSFAGSSVGTFGSLIDGNYRLIIHESLIHDGAGNYLDANEDGETNGQMTDDFFRLYGDRDGNREVGYVDYLYFRGSYGSSSTSLENLSAFDLNTSGAVDYYDYLFFRGNYGKKLLP